jgi:hypothetical protein
MNDLHTSRTHDVFQNKQLLSMWTTSLCSAETAADFANVKQRTRFREEYNRSVTESET